MPGTLPSKASFISLEARTTPIRWHTPAAANKGTMPTKKQAMTSVATLIAPSTQKPGPPSRPAAAPKPVPDMIAEPRPRPIASSQRFPIRTRSSHDAEQDTRPWGHPGKCCEQETDCQEEQQNGEVCEASNVFGKCAQI